jgi:GATA-binding protein, other eukaryote
MKKQEIKRRKRVVPATTDGTPHVAPSVGNHSPQLRATATPRLGDSVSPEPSTALPTSESDVEAPEPRGPIAVDFTNYYSSASSRPPATAPLTSSNQSAPSPRKRSISATLENDPTHEANATPETPVPHRPNAISSILNPSKPQDPNIDPALSHTSQHLAPATPHVDARPRASPVSQEEKSARKERLKREAEAMREELARRERELQELDE